jgi:excinuclease UvrABC helicase subunit UvrB
MNAISRAMISLQKNIRVLARQILETAIITLKTMPDLNTSIFMLEKVRSINYLEAAVKQIDATGSDPMQNTLMAELEAAVNAENYEKAAELRDRIRELSKKSE